MDAIIKVKKTVFLQFWCGVSIYAIWFRWAWLEDHQKWNKTVYFMLFPSFSIHWNVYCELFLATWMQFGCCVFIYRNLFWVRFSGKSFKWKNSVFHGVSLIFHTFKSILWVISGNIDSTVKVKETVLPQFWCYYKNQIDCFPKIGYGIFAFVHYVLGELSGRISNQNKKVFFIVIPWIFIKN